MLTSVFRRSAMLLLALSLFASPAPVGASALPEGCGPIVPDMNNLASVEVTAREPRVEQNEQFADCCLFCEHQSLEALVPTPHGPKRLEEDGGLPLRQKLCGTVERYGVNDELDDPRDIMLNIVPAPGFEHFVAGLLKTACSPLTEHERKTCVRRTGPHGTPDPSWQCPVAACEALAAEKSGKCLHAELTPAQQFYGQDQRFLPIQDDDECSDKDDWACKSALEPASDWNGSPPLGGEPGQEGRQACVYGVFAYDHGTDHRANEHDELVCLETSHHELPEIHPFDAVWFRHSGERMGWIFGAFQDDSNRYSVPSCDNDHNNSWSQGARDLTFKFPFRFARNETPLKACLRHTRTTNFKGDDIEVPSINVTTALMPDPLQEEWILFDGNQPVLEVVEPEGLKEEAQVRIEGCVTPNEVAGFITVRVAVGCPRGENCPGLDDQEDPGSGLYYAELTFARDCGG